ALPPKIEELEQARAKAQRTLAALVKDDQVGRPTDAIRIQDLEAEIERLQGEVDSNRAIWDQERELVAAVIEARAELDSESEPDEVDSDTSADGPSPVALEDVQARLEAFREEHGTLIPLDVDAEVVARVIADWTGIPVGNMVRDEARSVLEFEDRMQARIKGQDHALAALGRAIRASKAGVGDPEAPIGVFLAVGTSGVGKTECGLGLADLLFGGSRFLTTINMSEFGEKHTVSRLIGSPPGYVGYGEGGRLTEAVRKAPYSVVLLDEVEKADPEVMNLFYQVFDKGTLSDGEGREVDFKNTILYMTSNLGTDVITQMCADGAVPTIEELREALHPVLAAHFKPALLARMSVVPFLPIGSEIMSDITRLKLDKVVRRVRDVHGLVLEYSDEVVERIVAQCTQVDTGARNIDHILRGSFMPELSTELLARMADDEIGTRCQVGVGNELAFTFDFTDA
ncbi:MAG: AAA family ATPase, partial [Bacteroidota bacterium]